MITLVLESYDKGLPEVVELVAWLKQQSIDWQYILHPEDHSYRDLEKQIENSSLVVVVIGGGIHDTTWVHVCVQYCWALKKYRQSGSLDYLGLFTEAYKNASNMSKPCFDDNSAVVGLQSLLSQISSSSI